jgi:hypothetical protein
MKLGRLQYFSIVAVKAKLTKFAKKENGKVNINKIS